MVSLTKSIDLAQAKELLKGIGVKNPLAIDIMAKKMIHLMIKLNDVSPIAANIIKQEMLAVGGDAAVSHGALDLSVDKTDVLIMGTYDQILKALPQIKLQPFGLKRICTEIEKALVADGLPPNKEDGTVDR
jgi:dihydropteroate synthase